MSPTILVMWAVFGCVVLLVWGLAASARPSAKDQMWIRLKELNSPREDEQATLPGDESGLSKIVDAAAPSLSKVLAPKDVVEQKSLKRSLGFAGFHSPAAPMLYLAIKVILMIAGAVLGSSCAGWFWGLSQATLTATLSGAAAGCLVPGIVLTFLQKRRHKSIFRTLPDFLDLLTICVETGQGIDAALRRVGKEVSGVAPELFQELALYGMHMQMGRPRREALHDLGARSSVEDLNSLATVLIQADRFGTSIGGTLRDLSSSLRIKRRQMAEEKAQQTAVKLIFPLVLFIFPGIFAILVGPAAILMMRDMMALH